MHPSNPAQVVARRRFQPSDPAEPILPSPSIDWRFLLNSTLLYAVNHVNRWRWRSDLGGILPDGFDASSVAAEAIYLLLKNPPPWSSLVPPLAPDPATAAEVPIESIAITPAPSHDPPSLAERPTPLSLPDSDSAATASPDTTVSYVTLALQRHLERRVRTIVNRLHHRMENRLMRNEPDLAPVTLDDGEPISPVKLIPDDPARHADAILLATESALEFRFFKRRFSTFIRRERRLLTLFELYCQDCHRPNDIAARLKLNPATVRNLQKRFLRRWIAFHRQLNSPQICKLR